MSAGEMQSCRARVRGLPDPPPDEQEAPAAPQPRRAAPEAESPERTAIARGLRDARRYATDTRLPRTMRISEALYGDLTALVRELEVEGYKTDRTELLHALLHYELPTDADAARKLVGRWRRLIAE